MKTCTCKKALSLFIAVLMVAAVFATMMTVNASAAITFHGWDTAGDIYNNVMSNAVEWIPVDGLSTGNGQRTGEGTASYIYAFTGTADSIYSVIQLDQANIDEVISNNVAKIDWIDLYKPTGWTNWHETQNNADDAKIEAGEGVLGTEGDTVESTGFYVIVRLDSNRGTLTQRSQELKFELVLTCTASAVTEDIAYVTAADESSTESPKPTNGAATIVTTDAVWEISFVQVNEEKGVDAESTLASVTNPKFGEAATDYPGTAFEKEQSYNFSVVAETLASDKKTINLVLQFRRDRLTGNSNNGNYTSIDTLGFDIEVNDTAVDYNAEADSVFSKLNSSDWTHDPKVDATDFMIFDCNTNKVIRYTIDGVINPNEIWDEEGFQLVNGVNGQFTGNFDYSDLAYEFELKGDSKYIYLAVKLFGQSYLAEGKTAGRGNGSNFRIYLNTDQENSRTYGNAPSYIYDFSYDGSNYVMTSGASNLANVEYASTSDTYSAVIEIKIPYRSILINGTDLKLADLYKYLGFNFEFSAPAIGTNEQQLNYLVARTFGADANAPDKNCYEANYFTFYNAYVEYMQNNYTYGEYISSDYNNNLAVEQGAVKADSFNDIDAYVNNLKASTEANYQVITYRVSTALKSGAWCWNIPPAAGSSFLAASFDYLVFSDGDTLYLAAKDYRESWGKPGAAADQNSGTAYRFWLSNGAMTGANAWNNIIDACTTYTGSYNNVTGSNFTVPASNATIQATDVTYDYQLLKDAFVAAISVPVAECGFDQPYFKYAINHMFYTTNTDGVVDGRSQLKTGSYGSGVAAPTNSLAAYRYCEIQPELKLARTAFTKNETLKKNILYETPYITESLGGGYADVQVKSEFYGLNGNNVFRGKLNNNLKSDGGANPSDPAKSDTMGIVCHNSSANAVWADYSNFVRFDLPKEYSGIAAFEATFVRLATWGVQAPEYCEIFAQNAAGDMQRVGRALISASTDGTVTYYAELNYGVTANHIVFAFKANGGFLFCNEFQAYTYDETIIDTGAVNSKANGELANIQFATSAATLTTKGNEWWYDVLIRWDDNLNEYRVVDIAPEGTNKNWAMNYKEGDLVISVHSDSIKNTAANKNYADDFYKTQALVVGQKVYLYNNNYADGYYDLMMQSTSDGKVSTEFFFTVDKELVTKTMTSYNPNNGYLYTFTDLDQIGANKNSMIIIDSQSMPRFDGETTVPSNEYFVLGDQLDGSTINLWDYNVAIIEYENGYYVSKFLGKATWADGASAGAITAAKNASNAAKRALTYTTQGFAIISNGNNEFFNRLSRMYANDYNQTPEVAVATSPDKAYLYDIDLDALRLSYGNVGAISAKISFNHTNFAKGNGYVTTTESWADLNRTDWERTCDIWDMYLNELGSNPAWTPAQVNALRDKIYANIFNSRAFMTFTRSYNLHSNTEGLRVNPWVVYDGNKDVANLAYDEAFFAMYNQNWILSSGAVQKTGLFLINTDDNYEVKYEGYEYTVDGSPMINQNLYNINYINYLEYTFYYDYANGYGLPTALDIGTSANYSFMNHAKMLNIDLTKKTGVDGSAYPTSGSGTWTVAIGKADGFATCLASGIYTEFTFDCKQIAVVEINEKAIINDLLGTDINEIDAYVDCCYDNNGNEAVNITIDPQTGAITIVHDHTGIGDCVENETHYCYVDVWNEFRNNTFVDLEENPYLHIVMKTPATLDDTDFYLKGYFNGTYEEINLTHFIRKNSNTDGELDIYIDFAQYIEEAYGLKLKEGKYFQLDYWEFNTYFKNKDTCTVEISTFEFVSEQPKEDTELKSDSNLKIDGEYIVLDQQYKSDAFKQQFNGEITLDGVSKKDFVGTGCKVTVNDKVYTAILYGDLNGDGALDPADYIMIRRALLNQTTLTDVQTVAALGAKATKLTATNYIQIRQHVLGFYNYFVGAKIAQ